MVIFPKEIKILIIEFGICGLFKLVFISFSIYTFYINRSIGHMQRVKYKWTNSFFIKMFLSLWISINYAAIALYLERFYFLFLINSLIWIISFGILYFEFIRQIPQGWLGLRSFWLINGLCYIGKIIYLISMTITIDKEEKYPFLQITIFNSIQAVPSFILSVCGIVKNVDSPLENLIGTERLNTENDNNITDKNNEDFVVGLSINEIKPNKFITENNLLIPVYENNEINPDKVKLRFHLKLPFNKNHYFKKSLSEVIQFNYQIQAMYLKEPELQKTNSPLIMQLKNLTQLFQKKSLTQSKLTELKLLYLQLCIEFPFFLDQFLNFCKFEEQSSEDIVRNTLRERALSQAQQNFTPQSFKPSSLLSVREVNNMLDENTNSNSSDDQMQNSKQAHFINFSNEINILKSSDIYKIMDFITNIISLSRYVITFEIKTIIEKSNIIDTDIICVAYYKGEIFDIEINIKPIIMFLEQDRKINQNPKSKELVSFFKNSNNILALKKPNCFECQLVEECFNEIVNNLFFLDKVSFNIFTLNKLMNLDLEEIDLDIVNKFFDLNMRVYTNSELAESFYSTYSQWNVEIGKINIKENKVAINILNAKKKRKVVSEIKIKEFEDNCLQVIINNKNFKRFESLTLTLCNIEGLNDKFEEDEERNEAINELADVLNSFLLKQNLYIFYSLYFRKIFKIEHLSKNEVIDEDYEEEEEKKEKQKQSNIRENSVVSHSMLEELLN